MYTLKILPLNDYSKDFFEGFKTHHKGDSGIDIPFPSTVVVGGKGVLVDLGIKAAMYDEQGNSVSFWLLPRSSIYKTDIRLANSIGLIDAGYRGELKAPVDVIPGLSEFYTLDQGVRLFQIAAPNLAQVKVEVVAELSETSRGEGGFGSTGK